ncbi:MAG: ferritin-like domain-containing protein [Chloroflexota bacterium]
MDEPKASDRLMDLLNKAVAREMQVSIQYMWQHVLWRGIKGFAVRDEFKTIAIAEMKHAEMIAERINYFRGIPTTKPTPIFVGESLEEMLKNDKKAEEEAIDLYNEIIEIARKEGDEVTNRLFRQILADEEDHYDTFSTILEEL